MGRARRRLAALLHTAELFDADRGAWRQFSAIRAVRRHLAVCVACAQTVHGACCRDEVLLRSRTP